MFFDKVTIYISFTEPATQYAHSTKKEPHFILFLVRNLVINE